MDYAFIPSPAQSVWELPLPFGITIPLRAYALCIIVGIVAACWITEVRLRRRGAPAGTVLDIAVWAVPFGIVGGRLYHVITSPDAYFGAHGDPVAALYIWNGGLGIPGAVALGGVGVWLACRQNSVPFSMVADALAPGLPVAQAIGRLGNWFNQELYGGPTSMWWGVRIDAEHQKDIPAQFRGADAYEPTFLYELVWNLGTAGLVWLLDRKFKFGKGRAFALYVGCYGVGRFWIEGRRIDLAHDFLGLRVNEWMALAMVVGAAIYLLRVQAKRTVLVPDTLGGLHAVDWDSASAKRGAFVDPDAPASKHEGPDIPDAADDSPDETAADDDSGDEPDDRDETDGPSDESGADDARDDSEGPGSGSSGTLRT